MDVSLGLWLHAPRGEHGGSARGAVCMASAHRTRAWRRLRDQVVREEPLCWLRLPGICTRYSETADHVLTVKERPELAMERANLRGACHACNRSRNDKRVEDLHRGAVQRWVL